MGYRKNWNGIEKVLWEAYISFIAVHPGYWGQNISGLLNLALAQKLVSDGTTRINVTTWSKNPAVYRMYQCLDYVESNTLEDHRVPGVDTIYFRKSLK